MNTSVGEGRNSTTVCSVEGGIARCMKITTDVNRSQKYIIPSTIFGRCHDKPAKRAKNWRHFHLDKPYEAWWRISERNHWVRISGLVRMFRQCWKHFPGGTFRRSPLCRVKVHPRNGMDSGVSRRSLELHLPWRKRSADLGSASKSAASPRHPGRPGLPITIVEASFSASFVTGWPVRCPSIGARCNAGAHAPPWRTFVHLQGHGEGQ